MSQGGATAQIRERRRPTLAALAAVFVIACLPLVLAPIVPTIDFYDHMSRYFVLSHLDGDGFLRQNYESNWSLLPNIGLDVIGTVLLRYVSVLAAGKIVALIIFFTQYWGVVFFNRLLTGRLSLTVGLLSAALLYSFIFTWGFANFLLGLGLTFWGAGSWLALRHRLLPATLAGCIFALVIFLTHGVAFALYGLLLGGLELGDFFAGRRNLLALAQRLGALTVQAVVPALLFLASATADAADGVTNAGASIDRLSSRGQLLPRFIELVSYRLQTIVRVAEGPWLWLDLATFVVVGAGLFWLMRRGAVSIPRSAWPALLIGLILVAVVPPAMFGVGYVADRMPLFLALLAVGSLAVRAEDWPGRRFVILGLALILGVRLVAQAVSWSAYSPDLAAYDKVASRIPKGSVVAYVSGALEPRITNERRCEMYGPLLVSRHGQASALFAIPTAQPMTIKGVLLKALNDLPEHRRVSGSEAAAFYRSEIDVMMRDRLFDYVLVCDFAALGQYSPGPNAIVDQAGRFTLIRTH